jgi:hypothetical protein
VTADPADPRTGATCRRGVAQCGAHAGCRDRTRRKNVKGPNDDKTATPPPTEPKLKPEGAWWWLPRVVRWADLPLADHRSPKADLARSRQRPPATTASNKPEVAADRLEVVPFDAIAPDDALVLLDSIHGLQDTVRSPGPGIDAGVRAVLSRLT